MIADQLAVSPDRISADTHIMKDLGADSIDVMELLMTMEEEMGLTIPDEKIQSFKTVGDIAAYAEQNG